MSCGQTSTVIECQANNTNRVTLSVYNDTFFYGSHTYERSSPQAADVGPLHLHLQNATENPDNEFLTDFIVIGTGKQKEKIYIICKDVQSILTLTVSTESEFGYLLARDLHFYITPISTAFKPVFIIPCKFWWFELFIFHIFYYAGENCSNNSKLKWSHSGNTSEVMLQWEQPNCIGWEEILYYEVIVVYSIESNEKFQIEPPSKSALVSANVTDATVMATNICEESTPIATGKNDGTYQVHFCIQD